MLKKNELLLIAGILLIALLLFVWNGSGSARFGDGASVQVTVDGEKRFLLPGEALGRHVILGDSGDTGAYNVIEIAREGVRMTEANCPDKWCVRKGLVPRGADTIVCLPHRLIVRWIRGEDAPDDPDEVDVVL